MDGYYTTAYLTNEIVAESSALHSKSSYFYTRAL